MNLVKLAVRMEVEADKRLFHYAVEVGGSPLSIFH